MANPRIRVGVVESNDLMRDGLQALLNTSDDMACAGVWSDEVAALNALQDAPADVLLLDIKLPNHGSFDLLRELQGMSPSPKVVVTVDCRGEDCVVLVPRGVRAAPTEGLRVVSRPFAQPDDCLQLALKLGAHGVLHRHCSFSYLSQAIRKVHGGQFWMELPTAHRLAEQYLMAVQPHLSDGESGEGALTLRERQVAALVSQGRSNKEIATELRLGYSTVKNHVSAILHKLDLRDRTQIALYGSEFGSRSTLENGVANRSGHP